MGSVSLWKPLIWKWNDLTQLVLCWIISTNYSIIEIPFHLNEDSARKFIDCTAARAALRRCEKKIVSNCRQWRNRKENVPENLETHFQNSEEKKIIIESLLGDISEHFFAHFLLACFGNNKINFSYLFAHVIHVTSFQLQSQLVWTKNYYLRQHAYSSIYISLLLSIGPEVIRPHSSQTIYE